MKTFEELGVSPEILKAIKEMGYENPMPVQEEVIPYLLGNGNDVVALAQTGTGKTAAFGLPLIQKVDVKHRAPQALILCPTRELCLQIAGDLETKLAGRAEDKRLWNSVFYVNLLEQGQTECGCFTCSCLCKSYYIIIFS